MLVDTHAHLNFKDFQKDIDLIVKRSIKNGVTKIICVSSNADESEKAIEIAQKYPGVVFTAVGIHPQQTDPNNPNSPKEQIKKLTKLVQQKEVVAIGECGLDYSPAPPSEKDRPKEEQFFLFKEQIKLALQSNKPIIIHSRKAFPDLIKLIESFCQEPKTKNQKLTGVFHCYSAGKKGVEKVNELGFLFGVDGNLTYDEGLQNVFRDVPLEKILLETDCPFLAPEPFRTQRSEPAHVKIIAKFLAKLKGESFEKVSQITTQNAEGLFKI